MSGNSTLRRLGIVTLAIVAALGLFLALRDDGGDDGNGTTTGTTPAAPEEIVVENGKPVGGVQTLEFSSGERVRFTVRSDVSDHVHVHGYDLMKDISAGGTASFDFPATIEGEFEVELEDRAEQIADLRVQPG